MKNFRVFVKKINTCKTNLEKIFLLTDNCTKTVRKYFH